MRDYIPGQDIELDTDVDEKQFGELEFDALVMTVKELEDPILYQATEGGSVSGQAVAKDGKVFFGCCDRNFYCLDAETGEELWRLETGGLIPLDPIVGGGVIYFTSFDHNLYAVDTEGNVLWKFDCGDIPGNPGYHDGAVYVGSRNGNLFAVDAKSGRKLWKFSTNGPVASKPGVHKGQLYFGSWDHNFYCLDLKGGLKWKHTCGHVAGGAAIKNGTIYFGSFDCNIYAFTPEGKMKWKHGAKSPIYSTYRPVIAGDSLYFSYKDNCVCALDVRTGKLRWKFKTGNMMSMIPVVHGRVLYAGSCDGNMYAVDARTGKEVWHYSTPLALFAPPMIYGNKLYFGGGDSRLYCLTLEGRLVWTFKTSLSYPVSIDMGQVPAKKAAEVIWTVPERKEKDRYRSDSVEIADYGNFSGAYIDVSKSSYLGMKKEGYLKQKAF